MRAVNNLLSELKNSFKNFADVIALRQMLSENGAEVRVIGGAVRDLLSNRTLNDIDLAININPEEVEKILQKNQIKFTSIGKAHGTITAYINKHRYEITSLRKDVITDGRHAQVEFCDDWIEDARRRDFTINAMSLSFDGILYDYFNGEEDLKNAVVKFIGNTPMKLTHDRRFAIDSEHKAELTYKSPVEGELQESSSEQRIKEDYLRILRFFRFSAYYAKNFAEDAVKAAAKFAPQLSSISGTRIKAELGKIFLSPKAYEALKLIQEHKILNFSPKILEYVANLNKFAEKFNYQLSELDYFALFLNPDFEMQESKLLSAFIRQEKKYLDTITSSNKIIKKEINQKKIMAIYQKDFKAVILHNMAINPAIFNLEETRKLFALKPKTVPITAADFLSHGFLPDKELGILLKIAKTIWYDQEFLISKETLIKQTIEFYKN